MLSFVQKYGRNVYSQFGEDGIIEEVIKRCNIDISGSVICEFGAHDGTFCSNSRKLIEEGASAYLFEAAMELATQAFKLHVDRMERVHVSYLFVKPDNVNKIVPKYLRLLSIDVDGIDAAIWKAYTGHADIVIIEINSSLPPLEPVFADPQNGSSYISMLNLGLEKGYFLLCHTGNLIFVKEEFKSLFPELDGVDPIADINLFFNNSWLK